MYIIMTRTLNSSNPIYNEFFNKRSWITPKHIFYKNHYYHLFKQQLVINNILDQRIVSSRPIFNSRNDVQPLSHNHYNTCAYNNIHNGGSDIYYLAFIDFPGLPGNTLRENSIGMAESYNRILEQSRNTSKKLIEMLRSTHNSIKDN